MHDGASTLLSLLHADDAALPPPLLRAMWWLAADPPSAKEVTPSRGSRVFLHIPSRRGPPARSASLMAHITPVVTHPPPHLPSRGCVRIRDLPPLTPPQRTPPVRHSPIPDALHTLAPDALMRTPPAMHLPPPFRYSDAAAGRDQRAPLPDGAKRRGHPRHRCCRMRGARTSRHRPRRRAPNTQGEQQNLMLYQGGILSSGPGCGRGCHVVWSLLRVGRRAEAKARCDPSAAHPPARLPSTRTPSFLSCTRPSRPAAAPPV